MHFGVLICPEVVEQWGFETFYHSALSDCLVKQSISETPSLVAVK